MNLSHTIKIRDSNDLPPSSGDFNPRIEVWIYDDSKVADIIFLYKQDGNYIYNYIHGYSCSDTKDKEILNYLIENSIFEIKTQIHKDLYKIQLTKYMLLTLI